MVRINLTWILLALCIGVVIVSLGHHAAQKRAAQAQTHFLSTQTQVESITQLRREWENNTQARNRIERLLASARYKEAGSVVKNQEGTKADLQGLDASALNNLLRPLLQSPVPVSRLQIDRQSESSTSLQLEIAP